MPLANRQRLGQQGEILAKAFLEAYGYLIVEQNWRCPYGEIDLVARDGDQIVFVEVKTRRSRFGFDPLESLGHAKRQRMQHSAQSYLEAHGQSEQAWRIDVIAIRLSNGQPPAIEHLIAAIEEE